MIALRNRESPQKTIDSTSGPRNQILVRDVLGKIKVQAPGLDAPSDHCYCCFSDCYSCLILRSISDDIAWIAIPVTTVDGKVLEVGTAPAGTCAGLHLPNAGHSPAVPQYCSWRLTAHWTPKTDAKELQMKELRTWGLEVRAWGLELMHGDCSWGVWTGAQTLGLELRCGSSGVGLELRRGDWSLGVGTGAYAWKLELRHGDELRRGDWSLGVDIGA